MNAKKEYKVYVEVKVKGDMKVNGRKSINDYIVVDANNAEEAKNKAWRVLDRLKTYRNYGDIYIGSAKTNIAA